MKGPHGAHAKSFVRLFVLLGMSLLASAGSAAAPVAMGIEQIDTGSGPFNWFDEVSTAIIDYQGIDGSWPGDYWGGQTLATLWALLTLEKTVEVPRINVYFDIRPTSCPNPFNLFKPKGELPAAILGTAELDVTKIDPASLRLVLANGNGNGEVPPLRWSVKDVATPYMDGADCGCTTLGPDSIMDLNLKFNAQAVATILLDGYNVGEVVTLAITGNLKEEFGGTPIRGQDCVVIVK